MAPTRAGFVVRPQTLGDEGRPCPGAGCSMVISADGFVMAQTGTPRQTPERVESNHSSIGAWLMRKGRTPSTA